MRLQVMSSTQGIPISDSTRGSKRVLSVEIVDASGNQITSFGGGGGGGTQYAEGTNVPTATGTAVLIKDGSNNVYVPGVNTPLPSYLAGDDGSILDFGGSNTNNSLGTYILGNKVGGGMNIGRMETNPNTGEIGLNVNVMRYGSAPFFVEGQLSNNGSASPTNLVGTLPARASSSGVISVTDGRQVALKTDLDSNLAVSLIQAKSVLLDSTTALLHAGGSYTGSWFPVMGKFSSLTIYSSIFVSGFGGSSRFAFAEIQFSSDGINADGDVVALAVGFTDGNPARVSVNVEDNYARLVLAEQGGYDWVAAGGTQRTVFSGSPAGSGSYVRPVGTVVVAGDGTGEVMSPITLGFGDSSGSGSIVTWLGDSSTGSARVTGAGGTSCITTNTLVTSERGNSTATLTNTAVAASSTQLAASSSARRGMVVYNDSSEILFLKYGTSATSTSFTFKIEPGVHWTMPMPLYTGAVNGIANVAAGNWRITTW